MWANYATLILVSKIGHPHDPFDDYDYADDDYFDGEELDEDLLYSIFDEDEFELFDQED